MVERMSLGKALLMFVSKERGEDVLPDNPLEERTGLVGIGRKPDRVYMEHITRLAQSGEVDIVHVLARGDAWVAKSCRVAQGLVEKKTLNVFAIDIGEGVYKDKPIQLLVMTLVVPELLPETSQKLLTRLSELAARRS